MNRSPRQYFLVGACAAIVLTGLVGLYLVFDGHTVLGDTGDEPPEEAWRARLRGGPLEFIAATGRVIVNERGVQEIVWDPPELPTLRESILKGKLARIVRNPSLLPLCTEEYLKYLKAQKEAAGIESNPKNHSFPACNAIPGAIYRGPPSGPGYLDRQNGP